MRIEKIEISGFRSFPHNVSIINFPDIQKPISIIGQNNVGKTNLINSILYGLNYKYLGEEHFCESDFFLKDTNNKFHIHSFIKIDQTEYEYKITPANDIGDKPDTLNPRGSKAAYGFKKDYTDNFVYYFDFQDINQLTKIKNYRNYTTLGKKIKELKKGIRNSTEVYTFKNAEGEEFTLNNVQAFEQEVSNAISKYLYNDDFTGFIDEVKNKVKEQLLLNGDNISVKFGDIDFEKILDILTFFIAEGTKPAIPIENLGNGYKILFVIAILRAIADDDTGGNIFILEEPETFLHDNYQKYFYSILKKLAENNQVILTTHSKNFIDMFDLQTIIKLENTDINGTKITQPTTITTSISSHLPLTYPDDFGKYMTSIDPNLSNLVFCEKVILVEGPHDLLAYRIAFSHPEDTELLKGGIDFRNIAILPAHGKDSLIVLITICKKLNIPCFVIHDYDLPNRITLLSDTKYYNELFGTQTKTYDSELIYTSLPNQYKKSEYTKNMKLYHLTKKFGQKIHQNKPKLEGVLGYTKTNPGDEFCMKYEDKSTITVFEKLNNKKLQTIKIEFPDFMPQSLYDFVTQ